MTTYFILSDTPFDFYQKEILQTVEEINAVLNQSIENTLPVDRTGLDPFIRDGQIEGQRMLLAFRLKEDALAVAKFYKDAKRGDFPIYHAQTTEGFNEAAISDKEVLLLGEAGVQQTFKAAQIPAVGLKIVAMDLSHCEPNQAKIAAQMAEHQQKYLHKHRQAPEPSTHVHSMDLSLVAKPVEAKPAEAPAASGWLSGLYNRLFGPATVPQQPATVLKAADKYQQKRTDRAAALSAFLKEHGPKNAPKEGEQETQQECLLSADSVQVLSQFMEKADTAKFAENGARERAESEAKGPSQAKALKNIYFELKKAKHAQDEGSRAGYVGNALALTEQRVHIRTPRPQPAQ